MMLRPEIKQQYYQALLAKDPDFDGVFYVGVKTTGIFCRSTCPARKPKFENCEFYSDAQQALLASYRPCKRCRPLSHPNEVSEIVEKLVQAVEDNPEKRWKMGDFRELSTSAVQASRLFKKRFKMTFVAYARARRMGIAMKQIKNKDSVIETQLNAGYDSGSGFRDAFSKIMGEPPKLAGKINLLNAAWIDTPLGPMIAIANEKELYLLEFVDRRGLEREIEKLRMRAKAAIVPGKTNVIESITKELDRYFEGKLSHFQTPVKLIGSAFQKAVWEQLQKIAIGRTCSYSSIAQNIQKPTAVRAVGRANGSNQLAIIIPCHRVIGVNGALTGYAGGIPRKKWLLAHEEKYGKR